MGIVLIGTVFSIMPGAITSKISPGRMGCTPISGGWNPVVEANGNSVYVAWSYLYNCGEHILRFDKSYDYGKTFGSSVTLADSSQSGGYPIIASSGDNVYVAWLSHELSFKMSTDNGTNFENTVEINTNGTFESGLQKIIVSGKNIGIIWTGTTNNGFSSIYLSKSLDGGKTFLNPIVLSIATRNSFSPQVIQAKNKMFLLWSSFGNCDNLEQMCPTLEYFTTINIDNGFFINPISKIGQMEFPRIAVSGNNVYIAGIDNGITFLKSVDGGASFGAPLSIALYNESSNHLYDLALDASENYVYVTWYDFHSQDAGADLLMKASSDGGNTFDQTQALDSSDTHLSHNSYSSLDRQISVSGSKYYATWQSQTGLYPSVFFRKSMDGGQILDNTMDLSSKASISNPTYYVMSDGNHIYVVGPDFGFSDGNHIVFTSSTDGGVTFGTGIDLDHNSRSAISTITIEQAK